ncbi:hypothetical protein QCA50_006872 [Cerrena zonata]|uniref:Protein kinase domain-containing protein n=1 Tax=Cerrena zonata TaxID=2478898 RepID=A0AAW0GM94_9APHY
MSAHSCAPRLDSGAESMASASGIQNSDKVQHSGFLPVEEFVRDHLTPQPKSWGARRSRWRKKTQRIEEATGAEYKMYSPICKLLNAISKSTYEKYRNKNVELPYNNPIVFLDHHSVPSAHCDIEFKPVPEIVGVFASKEEIDSYTSIRNVYSDVPSYHIATFCEGKPKTISGADQAMRYTCQLLELRPDMPGVYGLCVNTKNYNIVWSDSSGPVTSAPIEWDDLKPLEAYIRSLYVPPKGHHLWDPSITSPTLLPLAECPDKKLKVHWNIKTEEREYKDCVRIHIGDGWGRRTTVFMHDDSSGNFAVIKDSFRDDRRRYEEASLLKHIHSEGTFPGVVRLIASGEVAGRDGSPIETARPYVEKEVDHWTKKRIVMGSRGSQLYAAESVREVLMTMYDGNEVLRALVNERDYMHRDVSINNFLTNAEHARNTLAANGFIKNRPLFIDDILGIDSPNDNEDNCRALIIDADNSALLPGPTHDHSLKYVNEELASRTGTPRYIARAVASGRLLKDAIDTRIYSRMPELEGKAKEVYIKTYGQDAYDAYTDVTANTYHGSKFQKPSKDIPLLFSHRPDHDIESLFWVLVEVVISALPLDAVDKHPPFFVQTWNVMEQHTIIYDQPSDSRSYILNLVEDGWEETLHPKLSPIVEMMMMLTSQVRPEYGLLDPPPKKDHLHEAFRRILLEQILAMEDDPIPLTPNMSRKPATAQKIGQVGAPRLQPALLKVVNGSLPTRKRKAEDEEAERNYKAVKLTNLYCS